MMTDGTAQEPKSGYGQSITVMTPRQLFWLRFRRHRLAYACLWITMGIYAVALFAEFLTPMNPEARSSRLVFHPPQIPRLIDRADDGWSIRPHVIAYRLERDPDSLASVYVPDQGRKTYLAFFGSGEPYRLFGLIPAERRLITAANPGEPVFFFGADRLGRDVFSRTIQGTRISMSIGLVGVAVSLVLGVVLGGISGFFGGRTDWFIQRLIEYLISLPAIPIWMALAAALPRTWSPLTVYFMITVIVSLIGWTDLGRVVRGRFLAMRNDDFVLAARLDGCSRRRIILRHMLPQMTSHIIATVTLAVPIMILAETSLSFLGLGLQPPLISWGVLLREAQNIRSIAEAPWLFLPGIAVVTAVLALNFLGDGLRDAADPNG